MKANADLEKSIGVRFRNKDYLTTALTHRSYLNEHRETSEHNERLEFLGDAVLELVVTEHLFMHYENPEGDLTNWRSALVKTETISDIANDLQIGDYLLMSKGEAKSFGRSRQLLLANAYESIIGAIFLDQGLKKAQDFITDTLLFKLPEIIKNKLYLDPKSNFQEMVQDREGITPRYEVIQEDGPDHDKIFTVGAFVGDKKWAEGSGPSKQIAQQKAAESAIKKYDKKNNLGSNYNN